VAALVAVGASSGALAKGTLDQSVDADDLHYAVGSVPPSGAEVAAAQTFTAGLTGELDTVALPLSTAFDHGRYMVDIRQVTASGVPDAGVLARSWVDTCRLNEQALDEVVFPSPASVTSGQKYAIVVERHLGDAIGVTDIAWAGSNDPYAAGARYWAKPYDPSSTWTADGQHAFRTYVSPSPASSDVPAFTSVELEGSPNPVQTGKDATYVATVIDPLDPGRGATGTVVFYRDGQRAAGQPQRLDSNGQATYTTQYSEPRTHTIAAAYCPDVDDLRSSDAWVSQEVFDFFPSETSVTVSPDPTVAGQVATLTASVAGRQVGGPVPTGSVQFADEDGTPNGAPIGDPVALDESGEASIATAAGAGVYEVHANYSGDGYYGPSSGTVEQTVERADTTTSLTSAPNPVPAGGRVEFVATVAVEPPGDVAPHGSLMFSINGEPASDPIPLMGANGVIVEATAPEAPGTDAIEVFYSGDENTNPSGDGLMQVVAPLLPSKPIPVPNEAMTGRLARMTAGLVAALRRRGFAALRRFRHRIAVDGPGELEQKVYSPQAPSSARAAAKRNVVIASATRRFSAAGSATMRLRLTRAGRRALRRSKALKMAIITRFTPSTGTPSVVRQRLTVRARGRRGRGATAGPLGWRVSQLR
jgi:hypothetical protein